MLLCQQQDPTVSWEWQGCHYISQHGSRNSSMMSSIIWELLIDEQYNNISRHGGCNCSMMSSIIQELLIVSSNTKRRHESRNCSSMSSIMKELLMVSSIILMSWHGSRNCYFDLIQLEGEQYVLAGVCWRLQEWILKVGLQSHKTAIKLHRSAQQNKTQECDGGQHCVLCRSQEWRRLMLIPVVETSESQECVGGTCKFL
jgi:hypothetical protein